MRENVVGTPGEFSLSRTQRAHAARVVASVSGTVDECRELLDMLGLDPRETLPIPDPRRPDVDSTAAEERSATG